MQKIKTKDLTGQRFGRLLVIKRVDDYLNKDGKPVTPMFLCECVCGSTVSVRSNSLTSGHTQSCGCSRKGMDSKIYGKNLEDLTGQVFFRWTVLYRADSIVEPSGRKVTMWHCRCECGAEQDVRSATLKNGTSKSCGCLKLDKLTVKRDLSGQHINRWYVLHRGEDYVSPKGRHLRQWTCRCVCGTVRDVAENALVGNKTISCGCYRKEKFDEYVSSVEYMDLSGMTFGEWTVLNRVNDRFYPGGGRATMWRCRCVCGAENDVAGNMLKAGISQSCGCASQSHGELYIARFLDAFGYKYKPQKSYDDLVGVNGHLLSYDFLVFDNTNKPLCLIEYQGEQHFRPVKFFGGESRFKIQQEHDRLKKEYAYNQGIPLIEIDYTHYTYDKLEDYIKPLIQKYINNRRTISY